MRLTGRQQGFTVIEAVIAFTMLSIVTIVSVGVVTQNSLRVDKLSKKLTLLEMTETALADVNARLMTGTPVDKYTAELSQGYHWVAAVEPYPAVSGKHDNGALPLWKIHLEILHGKENKSLMQLTTVVPGK
ncbi:MAG: type II secretion system GspH family protein [Gammaproteobacteria bacterium]|nr:type II secretion system GspH family protein [Gammaproteobacteria bacterium]MDH5652916.1 type II secretion system GspH family protein [Gammaproteobacteria bacterium]